jgi:predicted alpha/beta superfamily hydrolase
MRMNLKFTSRQRELSQIKYTSALLLLPMMLFQSCTKDKLDKLGTNTSFEMTSANTETDYVISVFYPDDAFPTTPVPVLLVLDGFWYGDMTAGIMNELLEEGSMPKCLMVSIDYVGGGGSYKRYTDLVYPHPSSTEERKGDLFYKFLTEELMPNIEANYATDTTRRTLLGHSLGGYFAIHSMFDHAGDQFFKNRVAASCSIGFDDNVLMVLELEASNILNDIDQNLFIGCGTIVGSSPVMHQELFNRLSSRNYPHLKVDFGAYPKTHGSDSYPTFKNGLRHVFN